LARLSALDIDYVCGYRLTTNTVQSYRTQVVALERLSREFGIPVDQPLSEQSLCLAVILYAQSHKPTTIPLFVSAVADWTRQRWGVELPRHRQFDAVMASLRNLYGDNNVNTPKAALTVDDLVAIHSRLDTRYFEHARDWCACLIAFFGLLRIGEYMDSGLHIRHVQASASSLDITIQFSKTSRAPVQIALSARPDALCPVRAFRHYREFLTRLRLPADPDSALFVYRFEAGHHRPMTSSQFIHLVRSYILAAFPGRDITAYAGHSFRRGGTSALILAGVHADIIKAHGRWSSLAYQRYFDSAHSPAMRLAATRALAPASK
jgi:hypothetical protein